MHFGNSLLSDPVLSRIYVTGPQGVRKTQFVKTWLTPLSKVRIVLKLLEDWLFEGQKMKNDIYMFTCKKLSTNFFTPPLIDKRTCKILFLKNGQA